MTDDVAEDPAVRARYDVVVVGGGHNALVAAAYLGRAGLSVCVLERADHVGGAAVSGRVFSGVDARVSRYSYLVSLLPDRIVADLELRVALASRPVASFTPVRRGPADLGLLVERDPVRRLRTPSGRSRGPTRSMRPGERSTTTPDGWRARWPRRCSSRSGPRPRCVRGSAARYGSGVSTARSARRSRLASAMTRCAAWR